MSPKPPVSTERLRALRQFTPQGSDETWHAIPGKERERSEPGFLRQNAAILALAGAVALALCFLGWNFWLQFQRVSHELEQTRLELSLANSEASRIKTELASARVIHDLWGLGSQFAATSAGACSADDDRNRVRNETALAVEM